MSGEASENPCVVCHMELATINAHVRYENTIRHAQERLAKDLDEIVRRSEQQTKGPET